jgi:hypothetical protein
MAKKSLEQLDSVQKKGEIFTALVDLLKTEIESEKKSGKDRFFNSWNRMLPTWREKGLVRVRNARRPLPH